jgi:hypothetical protein
MHSATLKKPAYVAPIAGRRYARAHFSRGHSHTESYVGGLVGLTILALVLAGLVYTVTSAPPAAPSRDIAADSFAKTRAARVVIPTDDGRCREYAFHNDNGSIGMDRVVSCDDDLPRVPRMTSGSGFESFKHAFGGKK